MKIMDGTIKNEAWRKIFHCVWTVMTYILAFGQTEFGCKPSSS